LRYDTVDFDGQHGQQTHQPGWARTEQIREQIADLSSDKIAAQTLAFWLAPTIVRALSMEDFLKRQARVNWMIDGHGRWQNTEGVCSWKHVDRSLTTK
jgi:hypothetical protein